MPVFPALAVLAFAAGGAAPPADPYTLNIAVSGYERETLFFAEPGLSASGYAPVLRVCYAGALEGGPELVSVHTGEAYQLLSLGRCTFVSGDHVEAAVWRADGAAEVSVTLLR